LNYLEFLKILQKDVFKTNIIFLFLIKICQTVKEVLNVWCVVWCALLLILNVIVR